MEHFFSPNSSTDLRADAHQSQIIGGDADEDHTQIVGGYTVKLLGRYIPHPPGFRHPWPLQTAFFLEAVSRLWLLFSWDQQRTRRKVDQFGALTFFLRSAENLKLSRPHQFGAITFLFSFFKINGELGVM